MVKGKVLQFRRGRKNITPRHFILEIEGIDTKEKASKFVNKEVVWTSPGKIAKNIVGKIMATHGRKGVVRAIFERGLPGQAIGTEVEILSGEDKKAKLISAGENEPEKKA